MKIVYIGAGDRLAEVFLERMGKEGNDVYFLSQEKPPPRTSNLWKYRYYKISSQEDLFRKVMQSIAPEWVVFAGAHFMDSVYQEQEEDDVTLLARTLRILSQQQETGFLLLSSVEVYGNAGGKAEERHGFMPVSEKGMRYVREEQLLEVYRKRYGLRASVIRASQLYSERAREGAKDFLSRSFADVIGTERGRRLPDDTLQPLHVADFVDAVKRVMDSGKTGAYNVSGSFGLSRKHLYALIERQTGIAAQGIRWEENPQGGTADNSLIKKELEWTDFRRLEEQFSTGEISFERKEKESRKKRKGPIPSNVRRTLENLAVFTVFFLIYYISAAHSLFSQIDWLTIYVILISVFMGIRQSALSVILASAAYLFLQDLSIFSMTNFYSYAESVLRIMEFVFLGLVVSYTTDMLREELRDTQRELKMLEGEHEELKKINDENVMIKNEYEERILDSKSGFPNLYRIVNRLMVLQPDRIFMEIVNIIAQMVHTDTVAVYRVNGDSPYLRLLNALNEKSVQGGKTWDISEYPAVRASMDAGTLYQGDEWDKEPSVVLPILYQGKCVSVILIKTLPYTSRTLYYSNLLKTLSLLLCEAVGRALDHEKLIRAELYIEGTDILKPEPFRRNLLLAGERRTKNLAEYCVAQVLYAGSLEEAYGAAASKLRTTDCFGVDEAGSLYVLLYNTGAEDMEYLRKRLEKDNVTLNLTTAFEEPEG